MLRGILDDEDDGHRGVEALATLRGVMRHGLLYRIAQNHELIGAMQALSVRAICVAVGQPLVTCCVKYACVSKVHLYVPAAATVMLPTSCMWGDEWGEQDSDLLCVVCP